MNFLFAAAVVVFVVALLGWYLVRRRNTAHPEDGRGPHDQERR